MPKIEVSKATKDRLKANFDSSEDTFDSVINVALDNLKSSGKSKKGQKDTKLNEIMLDSNRLVDVTNTKILDAKINANKVKKLNWKLILIELLELSYSRYGFTGSDMKNQKFLKRIEVGRIEERGYTFLPKLDISIPSLTANDSLEAIVKVAKTIDANIDIGFKWPPKPGKDNSGKNGRIKF